MSEAICAVSDCTRPVKTRGWCNAHYMRWFHWGDPLHGGPIRPRGPNKRRKPKKPCSVADCDRNAVCRGWCDKHYRRWLAYGDPHTTSIIVGDDEKRFLSKLGEPTPSGCIEWQQPTHRFGYGWITIRRRAVLAHRFAWIRANGPIPDGMDVLHRCDNPPCCNPEHLFLGTRADNAKDMIAKGRAAWQKSPDSGGRSNTPRSQEKG